MTDTLLPAVLDFAIRATVILLLAWGAVSLLRRASAATRHLVWSVAIAGVLLLPLMSAVLPAWRVAVLPAELPTAAPMLADVPRDFTAPAAQPVAFPGAEPAVQAGEPHDEVAAGSLLIERAAALRLTPAYGIALAWLFLAAILLVRLAIAKARVASWQRSSRLVEDAGWLALMRRLSRQYGIERPVVLLENDATDVPVTWGIVYPVVLLPTSASSWDEEQRVSVLTHELAHVKRFDAFTQMLAQVALALLWFHPLVWLAIRRMRLEREHACDDFVLVAGARASRYADDLLGLARRLSRQTAPAAAALAMARRSELEGRLLAILDPAAKRTAVRRARVAALTLGVTALAVPLATARLARATVPQGVAVVEAPAVSSMADVVAAPQARVPEAAPPVEPEPPVAAPPVAWQEPGADAAVPSVSVIGAQRALGLVKVRPDTEPPPRPVDVQTLIDVTRHAKKMTSDYEKGRLLADIAKRYVRNDELRDAYLETVFSMSSDFERGKALIALLDRDSIPSVSTARVLRSAVLMTGDAQRGQVLRRIGPAVFADTSVQRAYLEVITAMTSDTERSAAITALINSQPLVPSTQLALLRATSAITSSFEKSKLLLAFAEKQGIADSTVRRVFMRTAEALTSDSDYRRVMSAVMR